MTQTLTLAFYVSRGNWVDRAIRHATGSAYSHVELLAPYEGRRTKTMRAISSSPRDGGVRVKEITFHPARWSFVDLHPWHRAWPPRYPAGSGGKNWQTGSPARRSGCSAGLHGLTLWRA